MMNPVEDDDVDDDVLSSSMMIPASAAAAAAGAGAVSSVEGMATPSGQPSILQNTGEMILVEPVAIAPLLVPPEDDDAEVKASRITQHNQMTTMVEAEERLRLQMVEQGEVIAATDKVVVQDSSTVDALKKRPSRRLFLLLLVLLIIGGAVMLGILLRRNNNDSNSSELLNVPPPAPTTTTTTTPVMPAMPTPTPSLDILEELRSWIAPSDNELALFSDLASAQSRALEWLKNDTTSSATSPSRSTQDLLQRYVLAVLYFATGGPNWQRSYLSSKNVCTWNYFATDFDTRQGVFCLLDNVTVNQLDLRLNNLQGSLPWELALLTNLEVISLYANNLSGGIPTRISELTRLRIFSAPDNCLSGSLPETFSVDTVEIDLGNYGYACQNKFTGTIPPSWATSMPGLETIRLSMNSLTGPVPTAFGQLSNLSTMTIDFNQLTGTIPTELGQLTSLESLAMGANQLVGTLPSELGQLTSLHALTMGANQLTGSIPFELGNLVSLEILSVQFNNLTGTIPSELGQLLSLGTLWINHNELDGTVPSVLAGIHSLTGFDFTENQLSGSMDQQFCAGNRTWYKLTADCDKVDCECCECCCWMVEPPS